MIRLLTSVLLFSLLFSKSLFSNNIAVVDIEEIINLNEYYIKINKQIDEDQKKNSDFLLNNEKKLDSLRKEIEDSKIILDENEINKMIIHYNTELDTLSNQIDTFNAHYQVQIIEIRKIILKEIIVLAEKYAKNNDIDLILDSTSYLIASNAINITNIIKKELEKINLNLEFEKFENN